MSETTESYVPAESTMAEMTLRAVLLGLVLSLVMCAANLYVGLKTGTTVSASIPASVISMGLLRGLFRRGTILENNVVHTIASAGESVAAGIIFTLPALLIMGIWTEFNYWETVLVGASGGVMGVVMMIPLRRAMVVEQKELRFPEGVACAEVLKAGDRGGAEMAGIFGAMGIGALFRVAIDVLGLFTNSWGTAFRRGKLILSGGMDVSPLLVGVGYICGFEVSLIIVLGGALTYLVVLPILAWNQVPLPGESLVDLVENLRGAQGRFVGIGTMIAAGVASIIKIMPSIRSGIGAAMSGLRRGHGEGDLRTERNISGRPLLVLIALAFVLSVAVDWMMTRSLHTALVSAPLLFVLAFFFVAVASYIVGLVGSTNSPVSGMIICTVLLTAGLLLLLGYTGTTGIVATLGVAGVICCATSSSGDICQDLKIAQIIGATPKRVQTGEILGTIAAAFIIPPILNLLNHQYGFKDGQGHGSLEAAQANMFAGLVGGIFGEGELPWNLVIYGAVFGVIVVLVDRFLLEARGSSFRLHAMPLAVGMYLPWSVTVPMIFGGIIALLVERRERAAGRTGEAAQPALHRGLLFSSGLVAGEALMAIFIALALSVGLETPMLPAWGEVMGGAAKDGLSLLALAVVTWMLWRKCLGGSSKPQPGR